MAEPVTKNLEEEETLRERIRSLKEQEKKLREERHCLETKLRELVFKRYKELEEKIG